MPAKTARQYRKAGAAAGRGEAWGKAMVKHTPAAKRRRWTKGGKRS
jgi:hypothetical protein